MTRSSSDDDASDHRTSILRADSPSYFAVADPLERALLGRMSAEVDDGLTPVRRAVVARAQGTDAAAGVVLFDAGGVLRGRALQTWLTV